MSFDVRAGEILGLAGVQGNGQTELCEALIGPAAHAPGHVRLNGRDLTHSTPRQRLHAGVAYVPEDRQEDGLVGDFSVADNMVLDSYDRPPFASGINLNLGAIARTRPNGSRSSTSAPHPRTPRWARCPAAISRRSSWPGNSAASTRCWWPASRPGGLTWARSSSCIAASWNSATTASPCSSSPSELDEIYALADRIAVMYEGRITGFRPPSVPVEELGPADGRREAGPGAPEAGGPRLAPRADQARSGSRAMSEQAPPGSPESRPGAGHRDEAGRNERGEPHGSFGQTLRESILEGNTVTVTFLAIFTAFVIGGLLNAFTNTTVLHAWGNFFSAPGAAIAQAWDTAIGAYVAMFEGSIFNPHTVAALFQQASFATAVHDGYLSAVFNPLSETCVQATPLMLAGLAVALPYQAGMFNIGAQSQFIGGVILATYLGYGVSLPLGCT